MPPCFDHICHAVLIKRTHHSVLAVNASLSQPYVPSRVFFSLSLSLSLYFFPDIQYITSRPFPPPNNPTPGSAATDPRLTAGEWPVPQRPPGAGHGRRTTAGRQRHPAAAPSWGIFHNAAWWGGGLFLAPLLSPKRLGRFPKFKRRSIALEKLSRET